MFGTRTKLLWISIAFILRLDTWFADGEKLCHLSLGESDVDPVVRQSWSRPLGQPQRESLVGDAVTLSGSPWQPHGPLCHGEQVVGDVHRVSRNQPGVPLGQSDVECGHYIVLLWQAEDVFVGQTEIVMINLSNRRIYFNENILRKDHQIFRESCTNPRNEYSNPGPCAHVLGLSADIGHQHHFMCPAFRIWEQWTQTSSVLEIPTMGLCVIDRSKCHLQTLFAKIAWSSRIFPYSQFTSIYLRHTISQCMKMTEWRWNIYSVLTSKMLCFI